MLHNSRMSHYVLQRSKESDGVIMRSWNYQYLEKITFILCTSQALFFSTHSAKLSETRKKDFRRK